MLPLQGPPGILVPYPLSPGPPPPERRLSPLHTHPEISILCPSLPSLAGFRDEFPLLCPPGEGSGSQLEKGGGIGHTRPPSASPLPLELFSIPATSALPLPGTDKVQLEAGTSCDCARSPLAPTQTPADSCAPGPLLEPLPCLGLAGLKVAGWGVSGVSDPVALATRHPIKKEKRRPGKRGPVGGSLVAQEKVLRSTQLGCCGELFPMALCLFSPQRFPNQLLPDLAQVPLTLLS